MCTSCREKRGKPADRTCHVPWNQRSSWDRRGFVQYKLPAATSLWQSQSLRLSGSMPECVAGEMVHETVWVERGAPVDKPVVMFTVGTMPNSRHAMCELSRCWSQCLLEYAEQFSQEESEEEEQPEESESQTGQETDVVEESEEEQPCEELDSQTGQEKDVAEESDEGEPCEESESQTGQETDAAIVGCLWVDAMSSMVPLQQVLQVARQQRKFSAFADIWNCIMTA